jgi:fermentation-respiration switch protein FrsA (DUF1100 family)
MPDANSPGGGKLPDVAQIFEYDAATPLQVKAGAEFYAHGVPIQELTYDDSTGRRVAAFLVSAEGAGGPAVVIAHGGSADGRRLFLPEAAELARSGCTVLLAATSFPRHGDIGAVRTAMRAAVLAQRRGLDVLISWAECDPNRLGYYGHSGGAFQGAVLSAVERRLAGLVLASAGSGTLVRLAEGELRDLGVRDPGPYLTDLERFDPAHFVAVGGRRRLLFQHGRRDQTIRQGEAERLYSAAAPPRQWRDYPCDHATTAYPQARRDRAEFLLSL